MKSVSLIKVLNSAAGRAAVQSVFAMALDQTLALFGHGLTGLEGAQFFEALQIDQAAQYIDVFAIVLRTHVSKIVGIATLNYGYQNLQESYIGFFILGREYRSMGLGADALAQIEHVASQVAPVVSLQVTPPHAREIHFWKRHGYAVDGGVRVTPHPVTGNVIPSVRLMKHF